MNNEYMSCADTAKLIRAQLKKNFPGVKFSVTSSTYAGGASIRVNWMDGPCELLVKPIVGQFCGGDFDGMIDMKISFSSWLKPDGTAIVARNAGTLGSMGTIGPEQNDMPEPGCRLVHFGADFVFTNRKMSLPLATRALAAAERRFGKLGLTVQASQFDGTGYITGDYDDERRAYPFIQGFMSVTG